MHLHHDARVQVGVGQPSVHRDHGAFDHIRSGALHGRVDGGALRRLAAAHLARTDVRQVQPPAIHGFHEARLPRLAAHPLHVIPHRWVTLEVALDVALRHGAGDAQLPRQTKGGHAVDEAEVDRLGAAPLIFAHGFRGGAEHFRGGGTMHVLALAERAKQTGVAGEMRHDAELDLRIVRGDELAARRRHERGADAAAFRGADGNVLQVRVLRGEAPGGGHRLPIGGVDAPGALLDLPRQGVEIGRFQLRQPPMVQNEARQHMVEGQFLQNRFRRRALPGLGLLMHRQVELVVEHLLQLLRRPQVEPPASLRIRFLGKRFDSLPELPAMRRQTPGIHQRTGPFDPGEHRQERLFDVRVHGLQTARGLELRPERPVQPQREIRLFRPIGGGLVHGEGAKRQLLGAAPGQVLIARRLKAQVFGRQVLQVVAPRSHAVEDVGFQHGVELRAGERHAVVGQHVDGELEVVPHLAHRDVFQERLQHRQRIAKRCLRRAGQLMAEGQVGGFTGRCGKGDAGDVRIHVVARPGVYREGKGPGIAEFRHPSPKRVEGFDACVVSLGGGFQRFRRLDAKVVKP